MGETRKRILRTVLEEIVCTLSESRIELLLHWRGGDHTRLTVARNRTGQHRWSSDAEVRDLIRALARQQNDGAIAATPNRLGLNRLGKRTGRGNPWTEARVRSFRSHHRVPAHRPGEMAERGELTLDAAASRLGVSKMPCGGLGAAVDQRRRHRCPAGVQGCPVGRPRGANRGATQWDREVRTANSRCQSKSAGSSVT